MHLLAQLDRPDSGVARVVNTAVSADPTETVFDDSHNTYLQVLTGTGALGSRSGCLAAAAALVAARSGVPGRTAALGLAVLLGMPSSTSTACSRAWRTFRLSSSWAWYSSSATR